MGEEVDGGHGHGVPALTHCRVASANSACAIGGNVRIVPSGRRPGLKAHKTSGSSSWCFTRCGPSSRRKTERQTSALGRGRSFTSCHLIDTGARCQLFAPGTPVPSAVV